MAFKQGNAGLVAIGRNIAAKRREKGLAQAALGGMVGLSGKSIARIEGGKQRLSLAILYLIARALGVPATSFIPEELLYRSPGYTLEQAERILEAIPEFTLAVEAHVKKLRAGGGPATASA